MFKKGAAVWVKLDQPFDWWPGEVENERRPWRTTFWSDKSWEVVHERDHIRLFSNRTKKKLIMEGMERFKANGALLSKFIKDVWMAEQKIAGRLDELYEYLAQTCQKLQLKTKTLNEVKILYDCILLPRSTPLDAINHTQIIEGSSSTNKLNSLSTRHLTVQLKRIPDAHANQEAANILRSEEPAVQWADEVITLNHEQLSNIELCHIPNEIPEVNADHAAFNSKQLSNHHCEPFCLNEDEQLGIFQADQQDSFEIFAERLCSFQSQVLSETPTYDPISLKSPNHSNPLLLSGENSGTQISSNTPSVNEMPDENAVYEELAPIRHTMSASTKRSGNSHEDNVLTDESTTDSLDDDTEYEPDTEEPDSDSEIDDSFIYHSQPKFDSPYVFPKQKKGPCNKRKRTGEEENSSEENDASLSLANSCKNGHGKRIYDKGHNCYFCGKEISKLARHILGVHKNETEVARVAALPVGCCERKKQLETILRLGDFYHNMEVLAAKKGTIIPLRRPSEEEAKRYTYKDYGPCPDCLVFFVLNDLHRHSRRCPSKKAEVYSSDDEDESLLKKERRRYKNESILLMLPALTSIHEQGFQDLLASMHVDNISNTVKSDPLIQQLGYHLFEKFGNTQKSYTSQTMRMMGRFLITLREREQRPLLSLESFLDTRQFDSLISSVRILCNGKAEKFKRYEIGIPSLALKIGYNTRKCATLLKGKALRNKDYEMRTRADDFLQLFDLEWTARISSNALHTLHVRKQNRPVELPSTSDLMALSKYQTEELPRLTRQLAENPATDAWYRLAEMCLSRLIIFNKRRSGEVSKIFLSEYVNMPNWAGTRTSEMEQGLSSLEKRLCETLGLLEIRGKREGKVPVIIPPDVKAALDILVTHRTKVGVAQRNPYLFARPYYESDDYLRGNDCLNAVKRRVNLSRPELITGTRLRKYIATVVQVFSLKETEIDWLARHLGHDIRVHREYYRLHESTAELAKVSRLLMAVDSGQASKWAGKSLADINFDETNETGKQQENVMIPRHPRGSQTTKTTTDPNQGSQDNQDNQGSQDNQRSQDNQGSQANQEDPSCWTKHFASSRKTSLHHKQRNAFPLADDELLQESDSENGGYHTPPKKKKNGSRVKRQDGLLLSPQQKSFIRDHFKISIRQHKVPGKADCEKCMKANPTLFSNLKDYLPIKWCVNNYIATCRRQMVKP